LQDFKIELQNKQLTIDFVNQSSLQTGTQDQESSPYMSSDKTEFAERLGTLNKRWQGLSHDVNEQLRTFEMLQKKWEEYESSLSCLQDWFQEQEDKVKQYRLIGHEVSVKQTLKECKVIYFLVCFGSIVFVFSKNTSMINCPPSNNRTK